MDYNILMKRFERSLHDETIVTLPGISCCFFFAKGCCIQGKMFSDRMKYKRRSGVKFGRTVLIFTALTQMKWMEIISIEGIYVAL